MNTGVHLIDWEGNFWSCVLPELCKAADISYKSPFIFSLFWFSSRHGSDSASLYFFTGSSHSTAWLCSAGILHARVSCEMIQSFTASWCWFWDREVGNWQLYWTQEKRQVRIPLIRPDSKINKSWISKSKWTFQHPGWCLNWFIDGGWMLFYHISAQKQSIQFVNTRKKNCLFE